MMFTWDDAMKEARQEMGYYEGQFIEDWDSFIELTKAIFNQRREEEWQEDKALFKEDYHNYLKSEEWQQLRKEILERDGFTCQKCGKRANDVHHMSYEHVGDPEEANCCVSLCRNCHQEVHNTN